MSTPGNIVHMVLVQWRADTPAEVLSEIRETIGRFQAEVPGIVSVTEGPSVSTEGFESGFEWALVVTFADAAARDGYLDHPTHLPVATMIGKWAERLVVFDVSV